MVLNLLHDASECGILRRNFLFLLFCGCSLDDLVPPHILYCNGRIDDVKYSMGAAFFIVPIWIYTKR